MEDLYNTSPVENSSPHEGKKPPVKKVLTQGDLLLGDDNNFKQRTNPFKDYVGHVYAPEYDNAGMKSIDETLTNNEFFNYQGDPSELVGEHRAQSQTWGGDLTRMLGRGLVRATTEMMKLGTTLLSTPAAIGAAVENKGEVLSTLFNNQFHQALEENLERTNELAFPVYAKKSYRDGSVWNQLTSTTFYAEEGGDGLGYLFGMMGASSLINRVGMFSKLANATGKTASTTRFAKNVNDIQRTIYKTGLTPKMLDKATTIVTVSAMEAGAEAAGIENSVRNDPQAIQQIAKAYRDSGKYNIDYDNKRRDLELQFRDGLITEEEYSQLLMDLPGQLEEENLNLQVSNGMRDVFVSNMGLLLLPNTIMHNQLFRNSAKAAKNISFLKKLRGTSTKIGSTKFKDIAGQYTRRVLGVGASEGFLEEGMQLNVEDRAMNKVLSNAYGLDESYFDEISPISFISDYFENLVTDEGIKSVYLGFLLGGGMTAVTAKGSIKKEITERNKIINIINNQGSGLTTVLKNDVYKLTDDGNYVYELNEDGSLVLDEKGFPIREIDHQKLQDVLKEVEKLGTFREILDKAYLNNDSATILAVQNKILHDAIMPYAFQGELGLEMFREYLEDSLNTKEMEGKIQEYNSQLKDQNISRRYFEKEVSEIIDKNMKDAKSIMQEIEFFKDLGYSSIPLPGENNIIKQQFQAKLLESYTNAKFAIRNIEEALKDLRAHHFLPEAITEYLRVNLDKHTKEKLNPIDFEILDRLFSKDSSFLEEFSKTSNLAQQFVEKIKEYNGQIEEAQETIDTIFNRDKIKLRDDYAEYVKNIENFEEEVKKEIEKNKKDLDTISKATSLEELKDIKSKNKAVKDALAKKIQHFKNEKAKAEKEKLVGQKINRAVETGVPVQPAPSTPKPGNTSVHEVVSGESKAQSPTVKPEKGRENLNSVSTIFVRIVSKVANTGKKLGDYISDLWIAYENNPRNKVGDTVNIVMSLEGQERPLNFPANNTKENVLPYANAFSIENSTIQERLFLAQAIMNLTLENENGYEFLKTFAPDSKIDWLEFLIDYTPIHVNPKGRKSTAPIDTKSTSKGHTDIYNIKTRPVRANIIHTAIENSSFEGLSSKITYQFPGVLQIDKSTEPGRVPENNILDFMFMKLKQYSYVDKDGNLTDEGYKYMLDNLFVIDGANNMTNARGEISPWTNKNGQTLSKGEFYLSIPMANGQPFYLKLNSGTMNNSQAEAMIDFYEWQVSIFDGTPKKGVSIAANAPESVYSSLLLQFSKEFEILKKAGINNEEVTVQQLTDLIVFDGTSNAKTRLEITSHGMFAFGSSIIELANFKDPSTRERIKDFFVFDPAKGNGSTVKRRSIVFHKNKKGKSVDTMNRDYLNFLFQNKILNTNAVLGTPLEPTFGGYTNIFISESIDHEGGKSVKVIPAETVEMMKKYKMTPLPENIQEDAIPAKVSSIIDNFLITVLTPLIKKTNKSEINTATVETLEKLEEYLYMYSEIARTLKEVYGVDIESSTHLATKTKLLAAKAHISSSIKKLNEKFEIASAPIEDSETSSDIEAQKDEIKRRRLEALRERENVSTGGLAPSIVSDSNSKFFGYTQDKIKPLIQKAVKSISNLIEEWFNTKTISNQKSEDISTARDLIQLLNANPFLKYFKNNSIDSIRTFLENKEKGIEKRTLEEFLTDSVDKINAKYDAEYVDAVKKGEMTREQAIQALEKAGRKDSSAYAELAALEGTTTSSGNTVKTPPKVQNISDLFGDLSDAPEGRTLDNFKEYKKDFQKLPVITITKTVPKSVQEAKYLASLKPEEHNNYGFESLEALERFVKFSFSRNRGFDPKNIKDAALKVTLNLDGLEDAAAIEYMRKKNEKNSSLILKDPKNSVPSQKEVIKAGKPLVVTKKPPVETVPQKTLSEEQQNEAIEKLYEILSDEQAKQLQDLFDDYQNKNKSELEGSQIYEEIMKLSEENALKKQLLKIC